MNKILRSVVVLLGATILLFVPEATAQLVFKNLNTDIQQWFELYQHIPDTEGAKTPCESDPDKCFFVAENDEVLLEALAPQGNLTLANKTHLTNSVSSINAYLNRSYQQAQAVGSFFGDDLVQNDLEQICNTILDAKLNLAKAADISTELKNKYPWIQVTGLQITWEEEESQQDFEEMIQAMLEEEDLESSEEEDLGSSEEGLQNSLKYEPEFTIDESNYTLSKHRQVQALQEQVDQLLIQSSNSCLKAKPPLVSNGGILPGFSPARSQYAGQEDSGIVYVTQRLLPGISNRFIMIMYAFAVLVIIASGYMFFFSGFDEELKQKAKTTITWTILALIIATLSLFIVQFITGINFYF